VRNGGPPPLRVADRRRLHPETQIENREASPICPFALFSLDRLHSVRRRAEHAPFALDESSSSMDAHHERHPGAGRDPDRFQQMILLMVVWMPTFVGMTEFWAGLVLTTGSRRSGE
ncbi:MAG: hypothetical protein ABWX70_07875, partial [Hyphomicrobium sp.]